MRKLVWAVGVGLLVCGCPDSRAPAPPSDATGAAPQLEVELARPDPHSFARADAVATHLKLKLNINFAERRLEGTAAWALKRGGKAQSIVFDSRDLTISSARARAGDGAWHDATWVVGDADPILGQSLSVELVPGDDEVEVAYRTSPSATGLQWLESAQTAGGQAPFLYSQSQAIHARSWIPCQDSPGIRTTYEAEVTSDLPLTALMSASREAPKGDGVTRFNMPQAIPSYLIALAVGDLQRQALGPRTGVWAEPPQLRKAANEFADTEKMIAAVEKLYGPYAWDVYEILVLPPAFPFGGMENPRLTFVTPTILAGDRSLVGLVAHELAHSWSGNLVTNATWEHIWLNEGFTVYIERRVVEELYGRERAEMDAMLGHQDLQRALTEIGEPDQRLVVELEKRDPDAGLNDIPYEKGALLLRALEEDHGRERFDAFLRGWFDKHAFGSVRTKDFVAFVRRELPTTKLDLDAWVNQPGIGPSAPTPHSPAFERIDEDVAAFVSGELAARKLPAKTWTPHEWLHFLRALPADLPAKRLAELDKAHRLSTAGNYEILAKWLELGVRHGYRRVDKPLKAFLLEVGRRKFLTPLYRALIESDRKVEAQLIYSEARAGYHPISQQSLDTIMGVVGTLAQEQ